MIQNLTVIFNMKKLNTISSNKILFFVLFLSFFSSRLAVGVNQILMIVLCTLAILNYFGLFHFIHRFNRQNITVLFNAFFFLMSEISIFYILWVRVPWLQKNIDSGTLLFIFFLPLSIILKMSISENAIIAVSSFAMVPLLMLSSSSISAEVFAVFTYLVLVLVILQEMKARALSKLQINNV